MALSGKFLQYILEQLSKAGGVLARAMTLYFRGKVIGGIYDNRLLIKPVRAARELLPDVPEATPYDGAKPMLLIENIEDRQLLKQLFEAAYDELPERKKNNTAQKARPDESGRAFLCRPVTPLTRLRYIYR